MKNNRGLLEKNFYKKKLLLQKMKHKKYFKHCNVIRFKK